MSHIVVHKSKNTILPLVLTRNRFLAGSAAKVAC